MNNTIGGINRQTNDTIQTIKAFLGALNISLRIRDTWKYMRNIVEHPVKAREEGEGDKAVLE